MAGKSGPDLTGPRSKSEKLAGASAVVVELPRSRVTVEVERMSRGPAKVSIRIDGEDSDACAAEALGVYTRMTEAVNALEPQPPEG